MVSVDVHDVFINTVKGLIDLKASSRSSNSTSARASTDLFVEDALVLEEPTVMVREAPKLQAKTQNPKTLKHKPLTPQILHARCAQPVP